ncbi:hypothetical protein [Amaricoccus sp. W119]|uniref:hypothetical protein n=1 Tax=Amaricoccus sp. W119 TaxID=3391833 RepID=UPI0039A5096F
MPNAPGIDRDPPRDITVMKPDISWEEALAVQLGVKRRAVARGDRIVGHQGSFISAPVQRMFPGCPVPMCGTLMASLARAYGDEVELDGDPVLIESEIAVLLGRDLEGGQA